MDDHKPKPWHGWRELAKEIGTIVIGVLIALGAEQAVEALHWRHKVAVAEAAVRLELHDDDGPQAYARTLFAACLGARLNAVTAALKADQPRQAIAAVAEGFKSPFRSWDAEAWRAMVSSDALNHMSSVQADRWSAPYDLLPILADYNGREYQDAIDLRALDPKPGMLTPQERDRLVVAIQKLRADDRQMTIGSQNLLRAMAEAGVTLTTADRRRVLSELRPTWGPCLAEAPPYIVDLNSQASPRR